ncbi:MAG TPA: hypothetical protein VF656_10435 [Pyrinomonadaceae bacterium]|jgi:hypothetical protein
MEYLSLSADHLIKKARRPMLKALLLSSSDGALMFEGGGRSLIGWNVNSTLASLSERAGQVADDVRDFGGDASGGLRDRG